MPITQHQCQTATLKDMTKLQFFSPTEHSLHMTFLNLFTFEKLKLEITIVQLNIL